MAATVAVGYYAICFPNPIGTSGINIVTLVGGTILNTKTALLPQSCLGIHLTVLSAGVATANTVFRAISGAATTATYFYFFNRPEEVAANTMAAP